MLSTKEIHSLLVFDLEVVPAFEAYDAVDDRTKAQWERRCRRFRKENPDRSPADWWPLKAAFHAEFAQVVGWAAARISVTEGEVETTARSTTLSAMCSRDELKVLYGLLSLLRRGGPLGNKLEKPIVLAGHNIAGYDLHMLWARALANGLSVPDALTPPYFSRYDTMEVWKQSCGSRIALDTLCFHLGLPSPKDGMDGSQVAGKFWAGELDQIREYCIRDVIATADCIALLNGYEVESHENNAH